MGYKTFFIQKFFLLLTKHMQKKLKKPKGIAILFYLKNLITNVLLKKKEILSLGTILLLAA